MKYKGFTYTPAPKTAWDNLSMQEKSEMMKVAVRNGITDLKTIREKYNEFAEGGNLYAGTSTDNDLVDWIIKEEGFTAKPTDIGDGKMTLGSGLTSQKWHNLYKRRGNKWSETDNRSAVAQEVADRRRWAEKNIPNWDTLPESSQKALLAYKYNYDFNAANSPKLFKALKDSNLHEAARQMNATSKDPKFQKGLMNRRKREQAWFLSDVGMPNIVPSSTPIIAQPVNTSVYNPYPVKIQNTTVAPRMVPDKDSYVKAHQLTEREIRQQKLQERWDAINRFNTMMDMLNIQNNPLKQFTSNNPIFSGIEGLIHADGGKIHIKPENKGKFTRLKERTGHSATWFKEHGTPAQKKMAVFDLNARHWKHGLGGNLFKDGGDENSMNYEYRGTIFDDDLKNQGITHIAELPEVIVKGRDYTKPYKSAFEYDPNFAKELPYFLPVVGDALDAVDVARDVYNGNYLSAGIGAGMLALPNFIEKPVKGAGKIIRKVTDTQKAQNIIDANNISKWTPKQWTAAQDAAIAKALNITPEEAAFLTEEQWKNAIARGVNVDEAQRLRSLNFKVKAPNTAQREKMYNASGESSFNEFNGGETGLNWFSESEKYAANHGIPRAFYINEPDIYFGNVPAWVKGTPANERYIEALKRLGYTDKQIAQKVKEINEAANSTAPAAKSIGLSDNNELVTKNNNTIKLADAVTFDDNGVRIPLGERDNFNLNDIRL